MNNRTKQLVNNIEKSIQDNKSYNQMDPHAIKLIEEQFNIYSYLWSLLEMKKEELER